MKPWLQRSKAQVYSKRNLVSATLPHTHVKLQVSHEATQVLYSSAAKLKNPNAAEWQQTISNRSLQILSTRPLLSLHNRMPCFPFGH